MLSSSLHRGLSLHVCKGCLWGPWCSAAFSPPPPAVMNGSSHSPTAIGGAPSTPNGFSNGPATSCTAALSTQQLPPACGARQLSKLKRFLATLQQFGSDISPEIGERVRTLVLGLVVSRVGTRSPQAGPASASALPSPG